MSPSRLPLVVFSQEEERAAADTIVGWRDQIADRMSSEESHLRVRNKIKDMVRSGVLPTLKAIELAREYTDVDAALREYVIEMLDRHEQLPVSLTAYVQHTLAGTTPRGRGRDMVDSLMRNIGICCLIFKTHVHFGVPLTRNREYRRSGRPSACSLVTEALIQGKRFPLTEKTVQDIWSGLGMLATRLETALPLA